MARQKNRTWHRRTNEPEKAYQLFESYLKLGWQRSIAKAIKTTDTAEPVSRSQAFSYAQKYDWKSRAADYDKWKSAREEKHIKARLIRDQIVLTKKQINGRNIAANEALKTLKEIAARDLKELDSSDLLKQVLSLKACFEMLGLACLDLEVQRQKLILD